MPYPVWDTSPFGGGLIIAMVAIIHVTIAQFAVGAGIFNAASEMIGQRRNDRALLMFLCTHSHVLLIIAFVSGAVTGVGIWFTIALASPAATNALIHLFLWAWAIEWVFFLVEIVSGYVTTILGIDSVRRPTLRWDGYMRYRRSDHWWPSMPSSASCFLRVSGSIY